ncbi:MULTISPECIES: CrcB family protein [unclassified Diaminobutyricimonas]|uniref:fluoride efflux transporter FluC n=1 Tax=unclassified Diaminobutyricimonas TaxID=2643261 RepID=UPI0012F4DD70|nr:MULTISPECIES: CrcB family protein [unclassified Diaminobutyricimonas]
MIALAVMVAGGIGAVLRYLATLLLPLPWGVFAVNVAGSASAGAVLALSDVAAWDAGIQQILLTGFCGGLTTFSTFAVETVELARDGRWRTAVGSAAAHLIVGVAAAAAGWSLIVTFT